MSLLFLGRTKCPICNNVINEEDVYYGFPAFVTNTNDPLLFFNDSSFHLKCLENFKDGKKAIWYANLGVLRLSPSNRKCTVTGELIIKQREHIFIGYLTADECSFLHQFNFTHINILNLPQWKDRAKVVNEMIKLQESGTWLESGKISYLKKLIDVLTFKSDLSTLC